MKPLNYRIQLDVVSEGFDGKTQWFQPRVGMIPPHTAVLTATKALLGGSDLFTAVRSMRSEDMGRTWSEPVAHEASLGRREQPGGEQIVACDMTPAWHAASGKLLATGHTASYLKAGTLVHSPHRRETPYTVYDPAADTWTPWRSLRMPDMDGMFFNAGAGCTQRVDLEDGSILLPIYFMARPLEGQPVNRCYSATVVRCSFDGETLRYAEHGDVLALSDPRGFCEPSLTRYGGRFYMTLRNDVRAYVATSRDGLRFDKPVPWVFDDGAELGSCNTQQHWVTHSDGLFLAYTRRGANNDHVIRNRAPLFMAQVDTERLCVVRGTERILLPDKGAQYGNFGVVNASPAESWVLDAEGMHGDAEKPFDIERTLRRGANNRLYLCRIQWDRPNGVA